MKEEISGNVVEVKRKSERVMAIVLTLGREVMCIICVCMGHKVEDQTQRKFVFMMKWGVSGTWESSSEIIVFLGDFNGHAEKCAEGFEGVHGKQSY